MINELMHDPIVGGRFQFWLFQYNTGQPIIYSAMLLRRALRNVLSEIDPLGEDEALRQMVMIGHSQGGILTRLMAINSGNRFWENVTREPFESVEMVPETRELLREAMFFEPVPPCGESFSSPRRTAAVIKPRAGLSISSDGLSPCRAPWFHSSRTC